MNDTWKVVLLFLVPIVGIAAYLISRAEKWQEDDRKRQDEMTATLTKTGVDGIAKVTEAGAKAVVEATPGSIKPM